MKNVKKAHNDPTKQAKPNRPISTGKYSNLDILNVLRRRVASEEKYRRLAGFMQNDPGPVFQVDYHGLIRAVNPSAEKLYGSALVGASIAGPLKELYQSIMDCRHNDIPLQLEHVVGDRCILYTVLHRSAESALFIYGADISSYKRVERQLQHGKKWYRELFDTSPIGMARCRPDGVVVECNPAFRRMLGMTDRMETLCVIDIWDDSEIVDDVSRRLQAGDGVVFETTVNFDRLRDDRVVDTERRGTISVEVQLTPMAEDAENDPGEYLVHVRDITQKKLAYQALRESEERNRKIISHADIGIIVVQDGEIKFANPRVIEVTGFDSGDIIGRPFTDLIFEKDRRRIMEYHLKRMRGEKAPEVYRFRIHNLRGQLLTLECRVVTIPWEGKLATLAFLADISE